MPSITEYWKKLERDIPKGINPWQKYAPRGTQVELLVSTVPAIVVSGPAGTGKTRAGLEKLNYCCLTYPGTRALIVRKTRTSLSETGLQTFEQFVLGLDHPMVVNGPKRPNRQVYAYNNGSQINTGGLDRVERVLSSEYDLILGLQMEEMDESDIEVLITRLRGTAMPFRQILGDCNPGAPRHWIKVRSAGRSLVLLNSRHEENPVLHDGTDWTRFGLEYIDKLDSLTGVRKERLRFGRWVQSEGVVYEQYTESRHLLYQSDVPSVIHRYIAGIDWGYRNPGAMGVFAVDWEGRAYLVAQLYRTGETDDWWLERAKELYQEYKFETLQCGAEQPAYIAKFQAAGLPAVAAFTDVLPGITNVQERFAQDRLFVVRDSLRYQDESLAEAHLPMCLEEEIPGYVWADKTAKDVPVKENDHGMDLLRYTCAYLDRLSRKARKKARAYGTV